MWEDILKRTRGKKLSMSEQRRVYDAMISGEEMTSHEIAVEAGLDAKQAPGVTAFLRKCAKAVGGNPFKRIFPGVVEISKEEKERPKMGRDGPNAMGTGYAYSNPTIKVKDKARFKREIIEV
jgi:hypothetical protein